MYSTLTWGEVLANSLQDLYARIVIFLPTLIVAILVLIFGWAFAILFGSLVGKILQMIKIDELADKLGLKTLSEKTGKKLSVSGFGNWLVKWFFIVAVFVGTADILGLQQVSLFLFGEVLPFFGNVIIAAAIMVIGAVAANFMYSVVRHSLKAGELENLEFAAQLAKWAVLVFAFLAALSQLNVAADFMKDLFRGIVAMLAISGGIAFGLGGKEQASRLLDHLTKDLKK